MDGTIVRQTRSRTRAAAAAAAAANLKDGEQESKSVSSSEEGSFEPSMVDDDRADEKDCAGCDRPNRAELYMVKCKDCPRWYHLSCAGFTVKNVRDAPFSCVHCVLLAPAPPGSATGRSSTSSARARRRQLDMQRLEEEKALADKAAAENQQRDRDFLAKKYDLLEKEVSENGSRRSVCSSRSERVQDWVRDHHGPSEEGGTDGVGSLAAGGGEVGLNTVGATGARAHSASTPIAPGAPANRMEINDSISPVNQAKGTDGEQASDQANQKVLISPVDTQDLWKALEEVMPKAGDPASKLVQNLGGHLGATKKPAKPAAMVSYDEMRKQIDMLNDQHTRALMLQRDGHEDDVNKRRQRELNLAEQLRTYEQALDEQQSREADLRRQLKAYERQEAESREKKNRESALKDQEMQRLRKIQRACSDLQLPVYHDQVDVGPKVTYSKMPTIDEEVLSATGSTPKQVPNSVSPSHITGPPPNQINNPLIPPSMPPSMPPPSAIDRSWDVIELASISSTTSVPRAPCNSPLAPNAANSIPSIPWLPTPPSSHYTPSLHLPDFPPNAVPPNYPFNAQQYPPAGAGFGPGVVPPGGLGAGFNAQQYPPAGAGDGAGVVPPGGLGAGVIPQQEGPTRMQLAARHVVPKDLPKFSGDEKEWPAFISSYYHSTSVCGFSDSENLLRLQNAVIKEARAGVNCLLYYPHTVRQAIWSLQVRYGQPDKVVEKLIKEVLDMPTPRSGEPSDLVNYGLMVQNLCGHLGAMRMQEQLANPVLLRNLVAKLPEAVKLNWALHREQLPVVNLSNFGEYMARIAYAMSSLPSNSDTNSRAKNDRNKGKEKFVNAHAAVGGERKSCSSNQPVNQPATKKEDNACLICGGGNHQVAICPTFRKLDFSERWDKVKEKRLCGRCLTQHSRYPCKGRVCGINGCTKRHHQLMHCEITKEEEKPKANAVINVHRESSSTTLFRMLPVTLYGSKGRVDTHAFLDDGAQITMVERALADLIGLDGEEETLDIQWTGGVVKTIATKLVELDISAVDSNRRFTRTEAYVVDDLGLPEQTVRFDEMKQRFHHLKGLPVKSFTAAPGILIGLNNVHLLSPLKLREGGAGEPIATKTRLGWAVYGKTQGVVANSSCLQMHIRAKTADDELHELVREFFMLESLGVALAPAVEGVEDRRARETLEETTERTESGRWQTGLLWRNKHATLPNSEPMSDKRHIQLEKRLTKNPELYDKVRRLVAEMQAKGYTHKASAAELAQFDPRKTWFLPLGVVLNPNKPGKVRLILDAAAKVNGVSLNTELLSGPDLLSPLLKVMFGFRERQVAISGDIMEMFHQIQIRPEDRSAQLYKWRDSPELPLETMVMDVVIFGATCSPAQSQYVKNKNADEFAEEFPRAAKAIRENHYVDDYLDSLDTEEEAVELALQVAKVHAAGGFFIRNWVSNSKAVLERIGENNPAAVKRLVGEGNFERLLGIVWDPAKDVFSFVLKVQDEMRALVDGTERPTKREMLRIVMSIYDPCGLVSTFVIHGKILVQDVWRSNVGWDAQIPLELFDRWKQWLEVLRKMGDVVIPRCYFPGYQPESLRSVQLHVFVDASEQAYAACAYFRIVDQGRVRCCLVASKTKVAPLKPLSIPRLELLAMVLGVRLRKAIVKQHSLTISETHFWSDSSTVLLWIKSDVRNLRPYVGIRLAEILDEATIDEFRWVPTSLNVADEATKWGKGPSFDDDSRWLTAPRFLYEEEREWPKDCREVAVLPMEEFRSTVVCSHSVVESILDVKRFSNWERLKRCVSYVQRYIDNCRRSSKKEPRVLGVDLSSDELSKGERTIFRIAQSESYPKETAILKQNAQPGTTKVKKLPSSSSLWKTSPVIDEFGVLRVDTRIAACKYATYDNKHPVILSRHHHVTHLLIGSYHWKFKHANDETVTNEVRQRFHIAQLKVAVKATRNGCMFCRVEKPRRSQPRMGPLPRARLTPYVRAFSYVGVDYFGPYLVKVGRSAAKRWVALFTCLTTRAIHLEVASSLSTDSCKKAIRRFIASRGAPVEIFSDRGTNFIGASRELREEIKKINQGISSSFTDTNTQWKFNPPAAPHMGGSWERMVRSVKAALGAIPVERKLDEESLTTLLKEAQHMINSRPLTIVPLETADSEAITPNHFLMLSSNGVKQPEKTPTDAGKALRGSWNLIQHSLDGLWRRWLREYLPTITRRTKWFSDVRSIREGDLVVLGDEGTRNRWTRGLVVRTYPGKDGVPRRADVQISSGAVLRDRAVSNLALLDVRKDGDPGEELPATRGGGCCEAGYPSVDGD